MSESYIPCRVEAPAVPAAAPTLRPVFTLPPPPPPRRRAARRPHRVPNLPAAWRAGERAGEPGRRAPSSLKFEPPIRVTYPSRLSRPPARVGGWGSPISTAASIAD